MEIWSTGTNIQIALSEDEFEMLRQAVKEFPEAVDKHDCFLRTGYEMKEMENLCEKLFSFKLPREFP